MRYTLDNAKIYSKIHFFAQKFRSKHCEKTENYQLKTAGNQGVIFHRLTIIETPYMSYWARKKRQSNTCPLKNPVFQIFFPKTRRLKSSNHRKTQPWSTTTLPVQLSNEEKGPKNAFVENERQK